MPPARRIDITKIKAAGKFRGNNKSDPPTKQRPLGLTYPRTKIIQEAIRAELEKVYEPTFLESSHGFRPGKGCHTAIAMIDSHLQSSRFIIEADLSKCFDTLPHEQLLDVLKEKIQCQKLLQILKACLQAGSIHLGEWQNHFKVGTPQGDVLSP
jgi:retron-type reverse transcriptase